MRCSVLWCCVSLAGACASSGQRAEVPRSKPQTTVAPNLAMLVASVHAVALDGSPASHDDLARALHQLAQHIRTLPAGSDAAQIERAADQLSTSPNDAKAHVEIVLRALRSSQRALENGAPNASARTVTSLAALDTTLDALDPDRPLAAQQSTVVAALEAATNTLALLQSKAPPFPEPDPHWAHRSPEVALASARELTLEIARADIGKAAPGIGRLLEDFAALLHAEGPAAADEVTRLRFYAKRLTGNQPGILEEARWIREALTAALDGLEAGRSIRAADARAAVRNISTARSVAFQRARVQDAVRATLAAFIRSHELAAATTPR